MIKQEIKITHINKGPTPNSKTTIHQNPKPTWKQFPDYRMRGSSVYWRGNICRWRFSFLSFTIAFVTTSFFFCLHYPSSPKLRSFFQVLLCTFIYERRVSIPKIGSSLKRDTVIFIEEERKKVEVASVASSQLSKIKISNYASRKIPFFHAVLHTTIFLPTSRYNG